MENFPLFNLKCSGKPQLPINDITALAGGIGAAAPAGLPCPPWQQGPEGVGPLLQPYSSAPPYVHLTYFSSSSHSFLAFTISAAFLCCPHSPVLSLGACLERESPLCILRETTLKAPSLCKPGGNSSIQYFTIAGFWRAHIFPCEVSPLTIPGGLSAFAL